jgi:hypothetical protein
VSAVLYVYGVPSKWDFASRGYPPLVVDSLTGDVYCLKDGAPYKVTGGGGGGAHTHPQGDVDGLAGALAGKAASAHNHDGAYALAAHNHDASYAALAHNHDLAYAALGHAHSYNDLTDKPTLGDASSKNVGTAAGTVAAGDHTHAGGGGAGQLTVSFVADGAALALTNMALALGFLAASHRFATKVDLTGFTQVRLIVNKQATAGAAASKIILRYRTAFDVTPGNWLDIGASEVSVAINVQNTVLASNWINLAAGAKADVFVCPLMSGGDGALDPTLGGVSAQFK